MPKELSDLTDRGKAWPWKRHKIRDKKIIEVLHVVVFIPGRNDLLLSFNSGPDRAVIAGQAHPYCWPIYVNPP